MASEIKLPQLGENIKGGDIVEVMVVVGDQISEGQTLLEIEADKATVTVPSTLAGRVTQVLVKKGDQVQTGQTLFLIEAGNGQPAAAPTEVKAPAREAAPAPARPAEKAAAPAPAAAPKPAPVPADFGDVPAGPAARRLARQMGVDLRQIKGSAARGRITQEDVKTFAKQPPPAAAPAAAPARSAPSLPDFARWGPIEKKQLDGIRRATSAQMSLSWGLVPRVTQHDLADVTDLDAFRKQQDGKGPKLTVTAFALKAAAIVLRQFPNFNASLDEAAGQLILKRYYHIGIAVDTERGLLVPVLRDVDRKSVTQLAAEMNEIAERARQKKISADDMRGGTFTITNLGGIGGTGFSPIVNYPEVAILGMSRGRLEPVVRGNQVVPRLMLPLSLSYDHRVIDGADAARFTRRLADMLENPQVMLLHV